MLKKKRVIRDIGNSVPSAVMFPVLCPWLKRATLFFQEAEDFT